MAPPVLWMKVWKASLIWSSGKVWVISGRRLDPSIAHERSDLAEGPITFGAAARQRDIPLGDLEGIDRNRLAVDSNQSDPAVLSGKLNGIC